MCYFCLRYQQTHTDACIWKWHDIDIRVCRAKRLDRVSLQAVVPSGYVSDREWMDRSGAMDRRVFFTVFIQPALSRN